MLHRECSILLCLEAVLNWIHRWYWDIPSQDYFRKAFWAAILSWTWHRHRSWVLTRLEQLHISWRSAVPSSLALAGSWEMPWSPNVIGTQLLGITHQNPEPSKKSWSTMRIWAICMVFLWFSYGFSRGFPCLTWSAQVPPWAPTLCSPERPSRSWHPNIWAAGLLPSSAVPGTITAGGSQNGGTPNSWMVIMENPIKLDDLKVPRFWETTIIFVVQFVLFKNVPSIIHLQGCLDVGLAVLRTHNPSWCWMWCTPKHGISRKSIHKVKTQFGFTPHIWSNPSESSAKQRIYGICMPRCIWRFWFIYIQLAMDKNKKNKLNNFQLTMSFFVRSPCSTPIFSPFLVPPCSPSAPYALPLPHAVPAPRPAVARSESPKRQPGLLDADVP